MAGFLPLFLLSALASLLCGIYTDAGECCVAVVVLEGKAIDCSLTTDGEKQRMGVNW